MGNGIVMENLFDAMNYLLRRDHEAFLKVLDTYSEGKLGAYFVPPMFLSGIPEVIVPGADSRKKYKDGQSGYFAEYTMF